MKAAIGGNFLFDVVEEGWKKMIDVDDWKPEKLGRPLILHVLQSQRIKHELNTF